MGIISLLVAITVPVVAGVRRRARNVLNMNNQRQIVLAVNAFASDNGDRYPESVATITLGSSGDEWHWQEPTMMTACKPRPSRLHRSLSTYLYDYIDNAKAMFCPSAPENRASFAAAWEAGEDWDNPDTSFPSDPVFGAYCFYWGYVGFLPDRSRPFKGPRQVGGSRDCSNLLVMDYFGFGHWRNRLAYGRGNTGAYGSCERLGGANVTVGTEVSSAFWSCPGSGELLEEEELGITPYAGYVDGHVQRIDLTKLEALMVSKTPDGTRPYADWESTNPGVFYLPRPAVR